MRALLPRIYMIIEEINRRFIGHVKHVSDHPDDLLNDVMIIKDDQDTHGAFSDCRKF